MDPLAYNVRKRAIWAASPAHSALALLAILVALAAMPARATSLSPHASDMLSAVPDAPPDRGYPPGTHLRAHQPHPAVARIIVPEGNATSYGSGTLVDVRDQFGLVVTNWHVVRDGVGDVEVVFPDGFRSKARALKVDPDWDLAALVIWRPSTPPVAMAATAPQSGDQLTICGYGQGQYRAVTGRCTQYYSPKINLPQHMVELDVEARQGDSGGPIFNDRGELAGVLFGAGQGTTLGSFGGQVGSFLATLAPDIGRATNDALVANARQQEVVTNQPVALKPSSPPQTCGPNGCPCRNAPRENSASSAQRQSRDGAGTPKDAPRQAGANAVDSSPDRVPGWSAVAEPTTVAATPSALVPPSSDWTEDAKTVLAAIGALTLVVQVVRAVG